MVTLRPTVAECCNGYWRVEVAQSALTPGQPNTTPLNVVKYHLTAYNATMIKTFRHKGLEAFFRTGSKAGIQPRHAGKLRVMLTMLDSAKRADDMNAPGWRFHPLIGNYAGYYSVTVNGNWRLTFAFVNENAELVDYLDYH